MPVDALELEPKLGLVPGLGLRFALGLGLGFRLRLRIGKPGALELASALAMIVISRSPLGSNETPTIYEEPCVLRPGQ
ncbi:MAG: hypothetical protein H6729_09270 [Deltaproteobacteria bacterium]|nr:hypothetical protein [Deltaproteobacteria bacterium]